MISILASGTLIKKPVERTSQGSGRKFVTAQIRASGDGESFVLSLIAFNDVACKSLLALDKGDDVCVAGPGKPNSWIGKDGSPAFGLSVVAQQILTQYRLKEKRKAASQTESRDFLPSSATPQLDADGTALF